MKIVSLNVNRFGGRHHFDYGKKKWDNEECTEEYRRNIADRIINFVENDSADIFHFQEVDAKKAGNTFIENLKKSGHTLIYTDTTPNTWFKNLTVINKKSNIDFIEEVDNTFSEIKNRWTEIKVKYEDKEIYLLNYHRQFDFQTGKSDDIYAFCKYIPDRKDEHAAILGDFNAAARHERECFFDANVENEIFLDFFRLLGYQEKGDSKYTWYKKNNHDGRRLDHCFVSEHMNKSFNCMGYTDEKVSALLHLDTGFTDHSAIVLEIT